MTERVPKSDVHLEELNMPLNGRFQVIEVMAAKLWTRTYLAQDLHRPSQPDCIITQLKAIPIVPNYRAAIRDLFVREVRVLEQLGTHPQIPQILTWFEDEHGFYVVQELVSGRSLSLEFESPQPWPPERVLHLLRTVLDSLTWVHRHGSLHGNLKPENLLRQDDGQIKAIDFSSLSVLQHTLMAAHGLFVPPRAAAQQGYQPLEQLQGLACAASDVYALGMMAVQALTGTKPVDFRVDPDTVKILWQEHLPSSESPLTQHLIPILDNMVQWDLPQRYANAQEVLLALEEIAPVPAEMEAVPALQPAIASAVTHHSHSREAIAIAEPASVPEAAVAMAEPVPPFSESLKTQSEPPLSIPATLTGDPPPASPSPETSVRLKSLLQSAIASPSVRIGAGGVALAGGVAAVGWGLLNSVDWSAKTSQLWERFAAVTSATGQSNTRSVKQLSEKWRQDWQQAATTFQQVETAAQQGEWAKAQALSTTLPDIPYWRDRSADLLKQANLPPNPEVVAVGRSSGDLETAFAYAREHKFTKALTALDNIPPGIVDDALIKAKTQEYREKQNVRAWFDLQRAFDRAIVRDFEQALAYLYQIPAGTEAYATAQTKIAEYKQKRDIQADVRGTPVSDRATSARPVATLPTPSSVNSTIAVSLTPETHQLNQQADRWLQVADQQIKAGQLPAALTSLAQIPLGTPAYAEARDRILTVTAQLNAATAPAPTTIQATPSVSPQVKPERQPLIMGRAELHWVESRN